MTSGMQLNLFGFYVLMSISTLKNYENKSLGTLCGTLVSCQLVIAIIIIIIMGFPVGSDGKEFTCNAGDLGLIPVLGRPPGGEHGNPLQYSCLESLHGQRSLVGYNPWGCKESDMTERLNAAHVMQLQGGGDSAWVVT